MFFELEFSRLWSSSVSGFDVQTIKNIDYTPTDHHILGWVFLLCKHYHNYYIELSYYVLFPYSLNLFNSLFKLDYM